MQSTNCIVLIDVDSFDLQICEKVAAIPHDEEEPRMVGDRWGTITSLNSAAKKFGISRNDTVESAMVKCPAIRFLSFPILKTGKPDYTGRRALTHQIIQSIQELFPESPVEMSSCDEFYVDLTGEVNLKGTVPELSKYQHLWPKTTFQPKSAGEFFYADRIQDLTKEEQALFHGAVMASALLTKIREELAVHASVGVGYNKLVAKLACGFGKPAGLTIVANEEGFKNIADKIPLSSVPGMGGKAGEILSKQFKTMADLGEATVDRIEAVQNGTVSVNQALTFLSTCQGCCSAKVTQLTYFSSINVAKQYPKESTLTATDLQDDLEGLCEELVTRIDEEISWNQRRSRVVTVSIKLEDQPTEGIRVPEVSILSANQIQAQVWKNFKHSNLPTFKMKRIDLTVKNFDHLEKER